MRSGYTNKELCITTEFDDAIREWLANQVKTDASAALQRAGIPAAPVRRTDEILAATDLADWWHHLDHPDIGPRRYAGFPWQFRNSTLQSKSPSPRLGQHSREILSEIGLSDDHIDELFANGISGEIW